MNKKELYKLAIDTWGSEAQINQGIEEMAELIQAINKFRRKLCTETITHVAEEIADVEIMLEQYKMIFYQESLVKEIKKDKLQRLAERLKEADEKLLMSECQQDNDTLTKAAVVTEGELLQELVDRAYPQNLTYAADGCDTDGNLIYDLAYCPNCGREFEYAIGDWGCNYCQDCGQALYWGDNQ